ncbi:unnamed protein product [Phaedon cochleariae]|uniref:DH domain-containing protein n=1 Tax=Phaedon cochleariae TaxID=80249 RepID=A0A9N9SMF4_PHACE|nr:unnamed protein product [Phaedon cochleariae]
MAAVVSHAMRRFPTSPSDTPYSSCRFKGGSSSRSEGSSALSRSMRYADPWLYGSVQSGGVATPGAFLLTPAFALCACAPDCSGGGGTKRAAKKTQQTTCKKCKGTRLPVSALDSKFGTVRCYPTTVLATNPAPARAGTVRVTSCHARPTILPPPAASNAACDPYDLVRRSRLTGAVENPSSGFRVRSVSPREARNHGICAGDHQDPYITPIGRRSILECDINPYELVSPDSSTGPQPSITLVNGQRIRVRPSSNDEDFEDDQRYEDVQLRLSSPAKSMAKTQKTSLKAVAKRPSSMPAVTKERHRDDKQQTNNGPTSKSRTKTNSLQESGNDYYNCQFKSILKKSSIYDDVESDEVVQTRSPSPVKRKGSQFYIPMPSSPGVGVKKKVQFLVESDAAGNDNIPGEKTADEIECSSEDDEVFEKEVECKEVQNTPENETIRRPPALYRSFSDRIRREESKVNFNDTMALRCLKQRRNLPIDFSDLDRLDGTVRKAIRKVSPRPNVPPPPPPPPKQEKYESNSTPSSEKVEAPQVNQEETLSNGLEKPDEVTSMEKLDRCISGDITVPVPIQTDPPSVPPRKRSNNKQPTVNTVTVHPVKIETPMNKTIVRISSPPAVHKLQIKNDYSETVSVPSLSIIENSQRKTSILINGDDCYSTVNVGDSVPLYQSSVVVKDTPASKQKKCSSIYITGAFTQHENLPSSSEKDPAELDTATSDVKDITSETVTSSELLTELLRDPVEAVRRNLVPHVCGKSDVSRRPRDKKTVHHSKFPPGCKKDVGVSEDRSKMSSSFEESLFKMSPYETVCDDLSSEHSSSTQYEFMDAGSDCYTDNSNRSSITEEELANRTKFYELLAESSAVEVTENEDHLYECIKISNDPIYEEIEIPPPLPSNPPPASLVDDLNLDKEFTTRSIFEGASKYDILSYLVDAKERGIVQEDHPFTYNFSHHNHQNQTEEDIRTISDSSEDNSLIISGALIDEKATFQKTAEIERNDSGVGSETSKSSFSKYRSKPELCFPCEDCEAILDSKLEIEASLCRKCSKKRSERKEIITEIVETEEKYSRDLQIILEEFYQPMLVAGLLTPDQLSAIFLNVEELLENSQALAEKLRDAVEIATEQGDEDLLTVNTGKLFLEAIPMLHAFETYCVRQGSASLLLASLEKDKELLRIFLRVSQMENAMLRRMNLNSFLMVPVQRVTKYPLLLARLYKVTPAHLHNKNELKEAQHKIELHLNHMNSETKDVPSKLWRRIGSSSGRRSSAEMDLVNIKLRKIAVDVLEWNHEEARFALEGKLLFTQPTDNNWRRGRTIKLTPVNALLVVNGKIAVNNRYNVNLIDSILPKELHIHNKTSQEIHLTIKNNNRNYRIFSYFGTSTEKLATFLHKQDLKVAYRTNNTLGRFIKKNKDKTSKFEKSGVYKLNCGSCPKPISSKTTDRPDENGLVFSRHGAREAALLLVRDKNGRYSLLREPLYLDRCVIAADPAWQSYFEVQELLGRDTFIFKAEGEDQTNIWYKQLQFFAQGMGAWRKRRNALANIMINGMGLRS